MGKFARSTIDGSPIDCAEWFTQLPRCTSHHRVLSNGSQPSEPCLARFRLFSLFHFRCRGGRRPSFWIIDQVENGGSSRPLFGGIIYLFYDFTFRRLSLSFLLVFGTMRPHPEFLFAASGDVLACNGSRDFFISHSSCCRSCPCSPVYRVFPRQQTPFPRPALRSCNNCEDGTVALSTSASLADFHVLEADNFKEHRDRLPSVTCFRRSKNRESLNFAQ